MPVVVGARPSKRLLPWVALVVGVVAVGATWAASSTLRAWWWSRVAAQPLDAEELAALAKIANEHRRLHHLLRGLGHGGAAGRGRTCASSRCAGCASASTRSAAKSPATKTLAAVRGWDEATAAQRTHQNAVSLFGLRR